MQLKRVAILIERTWVNFQRLLVNVVSQKFPNLRQTGVKSTAPVDLREMGDDIFNNLRLTGKLKAFEYSSTAGKSCFIYIKDLKGPGWIVVSICLKLVPTKTDRIVFSEWLRWVHICVIEIVTCDSQENWRFQSTSVPLNSCSIDIKDELFSVFGCKSDIGSYKLRKYNFQCY